MHISTFYFLWTTHTLLESLPISSSGHINLILSFINKHTKARSKIVIPEYIDYSMHITTLCILALFLVHYWQILLPSSITIATILSFLWLIFLADSVTLICYFTMRRIRLKNFSLTMGFCVTAICLLSLYFVPLTLSNCLTAKKALLIGLVQGCALLPGVSRLACTYVAGCWLGLLPAVALLFSCAIQFPLVFAAVTKGLFLFVQSRTYQTSFIGLLFVLLSAAVSYQLLLLLLCYSQLWPLFGFYMALPILFTFFTR